MKKLFIERMLNKKADENNIIDLNAYGIGLEDMYEALNIAYIDSFVCDLKEQKHCYIYNKLNGCNKCFYKNYA